MVMAPTSPAKHKARCLKLKNAKTTVAMSINHR